MKIDQKPPITDEVISLGQVLWDYHQLYHPLEKSDCILVLGSNDPRVAERGAELWLKGFAPYLIFSGGLGNFTKGLWDEPEADKFAKIAYRMGVPTEKVLVENQSTNTGENIRFTQRILDKHGLSPQQFIVVQKPFMERRSYATFKKHWPDKPLQVTSPQIPFHEYAHEEMPMQLVIEAMVGDLQRIKVYPEKGFQIHQDIPDEVWQAYEQLVELGFDGHCLAEDKA